MSAPVAALPSLRIKFGPGEADVFNAGLPVLAGQGIEELFSGAARAGRSGPVALFERDGWRIGVVSSPCESGLEEATRRIYDAALQAARGWNLARIWNYVPSINDLGPGGLENYMTFCRARSLAFEQAFGAGFKGLLPSASAVGTPSGVLTVVFAASAERPIHFENPLQVPAYEYPCEYGPRAPSFARGTVVPGRGGAAAFISGTAAIRGHATVAPDSTPDQLEYSIENLSGISAACGLGPWLDEDGRSARHFKVYLRNPDDLPQVSAVLRKRLDSRRDSVSYLQADLCRSALKVEIEASLFGVTGLAGAKVA
jgi:chorismate lyase / 3-hydroxybenzoate synthase